MRRWQNQQPFPWWESVEAIVYTLAYRNNYITGIRDTRCSNLKTLSSIPFFPQAMLDVQLLGWTVLSLLASGGLFGLFVSALNLIFTAFNVMVWEKFTDNRQRALPHEKQVSQEVWLMANRRDLSQFYLKVLQKLKVPSQRCFNVVPVALRDWEGHGYHTAQTQ